MSASISNGRVAALYSELAGISAKRRRAGVPDLAFHETDWRSELAPRSSEALVAMQNQLSAGERIVLETGYSAKLMDLCEFRPYELARDDCQFIRKRVTRHLPPISPQNANEIDVRVAKSALRLLRQRRFADAACLTPLRLYGRVALMFATKLGSRVGARLA